MAYVFSKLEILKNVVKQISKKPRFREAFVEQRSKGYTVEIWTTPPLPYLLITVKRIELEKCLLVICKIVGMFVKTWNAGHKYCLLYNENLKKPTQMQLSQKQKLFSNLFLHFWNLD